MLFSKYLSGGFEWEQTILVVVAVREPEVSELCVGQWEGHTDGTDLD